tara:strand:+ start:1560 stop:2720 length:1161 start_codon:yes stop_codon:yes gene_type:complete
VKKHINRKIVTPTTKKLFQLFIEKSFDIYFVGGCVRDFLLNLPIKDIDISTTALPNEIISIARENNIKAIKTGIEHGTITLVYKTIQYQITTFRTDIKTDGRKAVVNFSKDIIADASRRDLTINALYADIEGNIIDPLNIIADLNSRKIKFINNPQERIVEDNLRILRFFRFYAWFGKTNNSLDNASLRACVRFKEKLLNLSGERIGTEMKKLLTAPKPIKSLEIMLAEGILEIIMPKADVHLLKSLIKFEREADVSIHWTTRASVMTDSKLKTKWKLSNSDHKLLSTLQKFKYYNISISKIAYLYGQELAIKYAVIKSVISNESLPKNLDTLVNLGVSAVFPITSQDLIPDYQGKDLGKKLHSLKNIWIDSKFTLNKEDLLRSTS